MSGRSRPACARRGAGYLDDLVLRRSAQYFFMRALTALRCAAVIGRRLLGALGADAGRATAGAAEAGATAPRRPTRRSGNARKIVASSAWSSATRACAPRRAYSFKSNLAKHALLTRNPEDLRRGGLKASANRGFFVGQMMAKGKGAKIRALAS